MFFATKLYKNDNIYKNGKSYRRKLARRQKICAVILINVAGFIIAMMIALLNCIISFPLYTDENTKIVEGVCVSITLEEVGYRGATCVLLALDTGETFAINSEVRKHYFDSSFLDAYQNNPVTIRYSEELTVESKTLVELKDARKTYLAFSDVKQNQTIQWLIMFTICFLIYCAFGAISFINLSTYLRKR